MKKGNELAKCCFIAATLLTVSVLQPAYAWTRNNHAILLNDAYSWIKDAKLDGDKTLDAYKMELEEYVKKADDGSEKTWFNNERAWFDTLAKYHFPAFEPDGKKKETHHTQRSEPIKPVAEDHRMFNAVQCLILALQDNDVTVNGVDPNKNKKRNKIFTPEEILGNGLHHLQDYFAHLNATGKDNDKKTRPHGIPNTVKYFTVAVGKSIIIDNIRFDCHSDGMNLTDVYTAKYWHFHPSKTNCWRYSAARNMSIEYLLAFKNGLEAVTAIKESAASNGVPGDIIDDATKEAVDDAIKNIADDFRTILENGEVKRDANGKSYNIDITLLSNNLQLDNATLKNLNSAETATSQSPTENLNGEQFENDDEDGAEEYVSDDNLIRELERLGVPFVGEDDTDGAQPVDENIKDTHEPVKNCNDGTTRNQDTNGKKKAKKSR